MPDAFAALESRVPPAAGNPDADDRRAREVTELFEQLAKDFEPRNSLYQRIEKIVHGEIPPTVPNGFKSIAVPTHSPLPQHIKNTIAAALSVNYPAATVKPLGFGQSWDENATLREHFGDASFRRQEKEAKRPVFRLGMDALVMKGECVWKKQERTKSAWKGYGSVSKKILDELMNDAWQRKGYEARRKEYDSKTEEYKKLAPYPITTTDVLPETFYYLRGLEGFTVCGEVKQVPYYDTLARYGLALDRSGSVVPEAMGLPMNEWHRVMDTERTLRMIECWTHKTVTYVLFGPGQTGSQGQFGNGTLVKSVDHAYGDPFTRTLKGPYFQAQGILSHVRMPHRAGMGVLTPFLDLFVLLDNYLTMRQVNAHRTAYAAYKRNRPAEVGLDPGAFGRDGTEAARAKGPLVITPGVVLDDDIGPVEQPRSGVDFNTAVDEIRAFLEMALPSVLQGAVDTTESGWQLSQAVHLARLAWDPIVSGAERALSEMMAFEMRLIDKCIGERVYAFGEQTDKGGKKTKGGYLSIAPEDINGVYDVYDVKLSPELPSTEVVKLRYWGEAVERGFASRADAISDLGRNPDEVERQRMLEEIKDSDEVKARIKQRVFELLGQADQEALAGAGGGQNPVPADPGAALMGIANPIVPGQNAPVEPVPAGAGAPVPSAGQMQPGNPPGTPAAIQSDHLVAQ